MLGCTVRSACRRAASAAAGGFRGSAESTVRQNRQDSAVRRSFPVRFVWWTETETFGVGSLPVWRRAVVASEIFDIFAISCAVSGLAGCWVRSACRRAASAAACARGCWLGWLLQRVPTVFACFGHGSPACRSCCWCTFRVGSADSADQRNRRNRQYRRNRRFGKIRDLVESAELAESAVSAESAEFRRNCSF